MFESTAEALKFIKQKDIAMVDLKIIGIAGQWLHVTIPARQFSTEAFRGGSRPTTALPDRAFGKV